MLTLIIIIFILELSLLLTHEIDATFKKEWKMFIFFKNKTDEKAYNIFMLLHIPLFFIILSLFFSPYIYIGYYIVDIFLLLHMIIHFGFRKHPENKLNSRISKLIINVAGLLAAVHLIFIAILL